MSPIARSWVFLVCVVSGSNPEDARSVCGRFIVNAFGDFVAHSALVARGDGGLPFDASYEPVFEQNFFLLAVWSQLSDAEFIRRASPVVQIVHSRLVTDGEFRGRIRTMPDSPNFSGILLFYKSELKRLIERRKATIKTPGDPTCVLQ